jgi:hypothetical protein
MSMILWIFANLATSTKASKTKMIKADGIGTMLYDLFGIHSPSRVTAQGLDYLRK